MALLRKEEESDEDMDIDMPIVSPNLEGKTLLSIDLPHELRIPSGNTLTGRGGCALGFDTTPPLPARQYRQTLATHSATPTGDFAAVSSTATNSGSEFFGWSDNEDDAERIAQETLE